MLFLLPALYSNEPLPHYVIFLQQWTLAHKKHCFNSDTRVIKSEVINNVISVYILQNQFGCLKCHPQL